MANKNKFTLSNLLNNKKLAIILSVVFSAAIWASVAFNSTDEERELREVTVPIAFRDSNNLVIYTNTEVKVNVVVQGRRWVINGLEKDDIDIKPDLSRITEPGEYTVPINATNSSSDKYEIRSLTPSEVKIKCDYFIEEILPISVDIERISLSKDAVEKGLTMDTPILNGADVKGVQIKGPATIVNAIERIAATVEVASEISKMSNFPVRFIAYDFSGREVDTQHCQFINAETSAIIDTERLSVNVPVVNFLKVDFEMDLSSIPKNFRNRVTLNPLSVTLKGDADQVAQDAANIRNLGEFDIRRINLENNSHVITFPISSGVTVAEQVTSVQVDFDVSGLKTKTFSEIALSSSNIVFKNVPSGFSFDASTQSQIANLVVVGSAWTIDRLKASDVKFEIDLANTSFVGPKTLVPIVSFGNYSDVWAYFGPDSDSDYKIIVTGKAN